MSIDMQATAKMIQDVARRAAQKHFETMLGGVDRPLCGFAWVTVNPTHKGNTKMGRSERQILTALGFRQAYGGKHYELWMPGRISVQNVDVHYAGACAAAEFLNGLDLGFTAWADTRLD